MSLPESITRKLWIDQALAHVGWSPITAFDPHAAHERVALTEHPTSNGPADYVLYDQGQPLAVVEAKRPSTAPQNVLTQAQRYARGLQDSPFDFQGLHAPFAYSSNGHVIWFQDLRDPHSRSREVQEFHTPAALREMLTHDRQAGSQWLRAQAADYPLLRPYRRDGILSVEAQVYATP